MRSMYLFGRICVAQRLLERFGAMRNICTRRMRRRNFTDNLSGHDVNVWLLNRNAVLFKHLQYQLGWS